MTIPPAIKVLPPELAAQIAAGEVVERPVSVVKELLENSIDAGSTRITVEIKGGGIEQIRVTDDGSGIAATDVSLAFQHHATSKLISPEDLDAIATLGFRGEAIPSMAAVSRITMTTRPAGADLGHSIEFAWGNPIRDGIQGCPPGTSVVVADLFGNLPARRKFLKSPAAEAARVHNLIARYALAYPEISFRLTVGDRQALSTSGNGKLTEALLAVYGAEVAAGMLEVNSEEPSVGYRIEGLVSAPSLHRANRTYMTFFVNRRWIQSRTLSFALEDACRGLLPEKRYPLATLNLTLPFGEVDVNSHPAKREVRFHQEGKVYSALQRAVRSALVATAPVRDMRGPGRGAPSPGSGLSSSAGPGFFRSPFDTGSTGFLGPDGSDISQSASSGSGNDVGNAGNDVRNAGNYGRSSYSGGSSLDGAGPPDAALTPQQALPALRVVGQVRLTYIVAESPDGMYLVDQHAAHERVLFDRIIRRAAQREAQSQPLLAPAPVDLTPRQIETLDANREFLGAYGFELEHFGDSSYLVRAVPSILTTRDPGKSLLDVLDLVAFEGLLRERDDVLAASVACHSAIRAGQSMTDAEMRSLLEQLEVTDSPHTCPHGRPTVIHFSSYHMEREFGRR